MIRLNRFASVVVRLLGFAIPVLLAVVVSSALASSDAGYASSCVNLYAYDTPIYDQPADHTTPEGRPPLGEPEVAVFTGQDAADRGSHGPLACLDASATVTTYAYDRTVHSVRDDSVGAPATEEGTQAADRAPAWLERGGVAANSGSRLAEASAAAFRAADNPSSIFIKNKHLASSGIRGGKFASDDIAEVQGWVAQGLRSDGVQFLSNQLDDTFRAIVPAGRAVGTGGQTNIRVIVTNDGRVINAFPVNVR